MPGRVYRAILTLITALLAGSQAFAQAPSAPAPSDKQADAYYNYAMAHLYAEEAARYNGRGQFVNQAIDYYKKAMAADPSESAIAEELAEFYLRVGQATKAEDLANSLIAADPNNAGAEKILARMYAAQIEPDQGKVDPDLVKKAIAHFKRASELDPKDVECLVSLARLYRVSKDDAAAEKAYKAVISLDSADEESLVGLAELYAGNGDFQSAINLLEPVTSGELQNVLNAAQLLAEIYEDSHDFSKAADVWKRLIPYANGNQVRQKYCDAILKTNRLDEAISAWQDLANAESRNVEPLLQLSDLWIQKRNYAKAHEAIDKAKTLDNNLTVRMSEAELMDAEGKSADAIAAVQKMLTDTKKLTYSDDERRQRINMLRSLAVMQRDSEKVADSVQTFRQIADINPQAASVIEVEIIETYTEARDYKSARAAADAALKKYSGDKVIAMEHASLLGTLAEFDHAISELKAIPDAEEDEQIVVAIAQIQEKAKRYKDALVTLDRADTLSKTPQQKQAIVFMRGAMYEHEKSYDEAEKQFRLVLKADPDNAGALNYLGYMLADRNVRLDEAQQLISRAVDLEPRSGAYLDSLGWVHYRLNRLDQAVDELRSALDLIKKDPTIHDHLAEVYFKQGKFKEAAQEWEVSVAAMKTASPSEADPAELKRISQRLDEAKSKAAAKK